MLFSLQKVVASWQEVTHLKAFTNANIDHAMYRQADEPGMLNCISFFQLDRTYLMH